MYNFPFSGSEYEFITKKNICYSLGKQKSQMEVQCVHICVQHLIADVVTVLFEIKSINIVNIIINFYNPVHVLTPPFFLKGV